MNTILAIDPGHTESGWVLIDGETCQPLEFGKTHARRSGFTRHRFCFHAHEACDHALRRDDDRLPRCFQHGAEVTLDLV